jgi:hypothetical protein
MGDRSVVVIKDGGVQQFDTFVRKPLPLWLISQTQI